MVLQGKFQNQSPRLKIKKEKHSTHFFKYINSKDKY